MLDMESEQKVVCDLSNGTILMTLNDPNWSKCLRFYYSFEPKFLEMYATDLRPIFRIGSPTGDYYYNY